MYVLIVGQTVHHVTYYSFASQYLCYEQSCPLVQLLLSLGSPVNPNHQHKRPANQAMQILRNTCIEIAVLLVHLFLYVADSSSPCRDCWSECPTTLHHCANLHLCDCRNWRHQLQRQTQKRGPVTIQEGEDQSLQLSQGILHASTGQIRRKPDVSCPGASGKEEQGP